MPQPWRRMPLIDDPELGASMGKIGQERFRTALSWEFQVPHLLAAYERALPTSRTPVVASPETLPDEDREERA